MRTDGHARVLGNAQVPTVSFPLVPGFIGPPQDCSGPEDDWVRENALGDLATFTAWAARREEDGTRTVVVRGFNGTATLHEMDHMGTPIIMIDYVSRGGVEPEFGYVGPKRVTFWMNPHSISDLGDALRARPDMRMDFEGLSAK